LVNVQKEFPLLYTRAFRVEDMDTNPYLAVKISGMPVTPYKPEGQQFAAALPIPGGNFSVTAIPFGQLFSVTWEMWRDDLYGVMMKMWGDMGRSARYRQELQAWSMLNNAFSVATGYDATPLLSTSHTNLDGTIQSNRPSPDVSLSQTAIQAGQLNFRLLNDETSRPSGIEATRVILHPTNTPLARELFGSSGKPGTANNEMNALLVDELTWAPIRYLTRTQDWMLLAPVEETDLVVMWRDRPRSRQFDDPFTDASDFTLYERLATFVGEWRSAYGSTIGV
jgi:hypothetical protein